MSEFKPGDRVICIDDYQADPLVKGNIYTVEEALSRTIILKEVRQNFFKVRFRKYDPVGDLLALIR